MTRRGGFGDVALSAGRSRSAAAAAAQATSRWRAVARPRTVVSPTARSGEMGAGSVAGRGGAVRRGRGPLWRTRRYRTIPETAPTWWACWKGGGSAAADSAGGIQYA